MALRDSLAYRVFLLAATARDIWLSKSNVGDFSATVQRYYTGISLNRYLFLVCVELPLAYLSSLLTWVTFPFIAIYPVYQAGKHWQEFQHQVFWAPATTGVLLIIVAVSVGGFFFLILSWSERGPGKVARAVKSRLVSIPEEDVDKHPGPIDLLKKYIAATGSRGSSQITWDSGRRRRRF